MGKAVTSRLKQLRLDTAARRGATISIREVSRETGIAVSTLRRLEANEAAGIEFATLAKLAEYYGATSLDALLSLDDVWLALRVAAARHNTARRALA